MHDQHNVPLDQRSSPAFRVHAERFARQGFKPKINVTNPAGKIIVEGSGKPAVAQLFTGGINALREGGIKNLSAMVGGWKEPSIC